MADVLTTHMSTVIHKSGTVHLKQVLIFLNDAVSVAGCSVGGEIDKSVIFICRVMFPISLVNVLLGTVSERVICY